MNATNAVPLTKKAQLAADKAHAREMLLKYLRPGSTVLTILRHVSRSGMSRRIDLYTVDPDNTDARGGLAYLSGYAATLCDWKCNGDGIVAGGCGMDMGFHLVSNLSRALFPEGFGCIGKGKSGSGRYCPSNDHPNGDRDYTRDTQVYSDAVMARDSMKHDGSTHTHWHRSGDYAIRHEWL